MDGEPARALQALEQHAAEFPAGMLAEERESLWIQALVAQGRKGDARAKADAFREKYPGSILWPVVEELLRSSQ
jgi:outer membrane protein assembly factor BamD (BamD/ComL family)